MSDIDLLYVLAEAVSQLAAGIKADHPTVPWTDASRLRNRVVHGDWSVDFEVLIATARDDLPSFLAGLESVVASLAHHEASAKFMVRCRGGEGRSPSSDGYRTEQRVHRWSRRQPAHGGVPPHSIGRVDDAVGV